MMRIWVKARPVSIGFNGYDELMSATGLSCGFLFANLGKAITFFGFWMNRLEAAGILQHGGPVRQKCFKDSTTKHYEQEKRPRGLDQGRGRSLRSAAARPKETLA